MPVLPAVRYDRLRRRVAQEWLLSWAGRIRKIFTLFPLRNCCLFSVKRFLDNFDPNHTPPLSDNQTHSNCNFQQHYNSTSLQISRPRRVRLSASSTRSPVPSIGHMKAHSTQQNSRRRYHICTLMQTRIHAGLEI